jgi:type I restriction enzyme S subunit
LKVFYLHYPHSPNKKIAKILSTCDEVIEKTEAAIAKYKAIKQGMMHDLFTRGIDTATGKIRPSYQEASELYKESALGMIPKEWEVKRLEDVVVRKGEYGINACCVRV